MYKGWCRYWFRYSNASVEAHLFAVGASRASNSYFNGSRTSAPSMCTCNSMVVWTELLTLNFNKLPEFFRCYEQVRNLSRKPDNPRSYEEPVTRDTLLALRLTGTRVRRRKEMRPTFTPPTSPPANQRPSSSSLGSPTKSFPPSARPAESR